MKRFLIFLFVVAFSHHSFAQLRIEKRQYNRGWYISLHHSQKKQTKTVAVAEENSASAITAQPSPELLRADSVIVEEKAPGVVRAEPSSPAKSNSPAKKRADKVPSAAKEKITAPIAAPLHLAQQSIRQSRSIRVQQRSSYGDWDGLLLVGKILLWTLAILFLIGILLEIISYFLVNPWLGVAAVVVFAGCLFM